jgi:acyl-coenzyme A synthetase/AMP-(fatty) acid ligase
MAIGRKSPDKGWVEGLHYVNASPNPNKKAIIRIPWNNMVRSFAKNPELTSEDYRKPKSNMYVSKEYRPE